MCFLSRVKQRFGTVVRPGLRVYPQLFADQTLAAKWEQAGFAAVTEHFKC